MVTIAFHDNNLCLRGTTSALFDYADYNEKILGNKSVIVSSINGNLDSLQKFENRFGKENIHLCHFHEYQNLFEKKGVDFLYIIKGGGKSDGLCLVETPTLVHSVFRYNEPHGHKYRYVSDWLAKDQGFNPEEYAVPHMVKKLPTPKYNLRKKLGIGKDKFVFGYHGGSTEFNHRDTHEVIEKIVSERNDIYFIFMNVNKFMENNSNVIHLPGTWDLFEKSSFIESCDAMIHARSGGETFGCSVAEFSIMNKPVITYGSSGERSHIEILGDKGILYYGKEDLYDILNNFKSYVKYDDYYRCYDNFSPEKIMERFNKNFLN